MKIKWLQIACMCLVLLCVLGLGWEVYMDNLNHMALLYVFGAFGICGFFANAALAVYRVYLELKK